MLSATMRPQPGGFFDRPKIERAIRRMNRRNLSKAGAFVRRRGRSSIKKKRGSARPGKPPHSHRGQLRQIFFAYEPQAETVVVGPRDLNKPGDVPALLEHGGRDAGDFYAGNPFMAPALEAEASNFPKIWQSSLR